MAKDFFSLPISGVSVECTCSHSRVVCYYLPNQLSPETIKRLMILCQHWGLPKRDKLFLEEEKVKPTVADKDNLMIDKKILTQQSRQKLAIIIKQEAHRIKFNQVE